MQQTGETAQVELRHRMDVGAVEGFKQCVCSSLRQGPETAEFEVSPQ